MLGQQPSLELGQRDPRSDMHMRRQRQVLFARQLARRIHGSKIPIAQIL